MSRTTPPGGPRWIWSILLLLIGLYPICFMWQGLDVTDTGYCLANMQQFFQGYPHDLTDPVIASCWLTYFVGGIWYQLTGGCGLIGFRLLYLLLTYCILVLAYLPLRPLGGKKAVLSLLAATTLVIGKSFYFPSYNEFTAFCFISTALLLHCGLVKRRRLFVFIAGTCGGVSIFARLPNLAIGGIAVAIFFYRAIESENGWVGFSARAAEALRECILFGLGFVTGIGAVFIVMAALGHLAPYFQMLRQMSGMLGDSSHHHGGAPLLKGLLHDYFYAGLAGILFLIGGIVFGWIVRKSRSLSLRIGLTVLLAAGLTVMLLISDQLEMYFLPGLMYATLIAAVAGFFNLNKQYRLLCALAGLLLFLTPLGSNNGIYNSIYAFHLAAALAVIVLIARPDAVDCASPVEAAEGNALNAVARSGAVVERTSWLRLIWAGISTGRWPIGMPIDTAALGYAVLCSMIACSVVHRWQFTYRDSPNRLAMRTTVDHPKLRGIFTTPSRARSLEELLHELQPLVRKDDYLFDHMQFPLVYFLTEAKPYLYSTWAALYEPPAFRQAMEKAFLSRPSLPVCVLTKIDTAHPKWPDETYPPLPYHRHVENRRTVGSFLEKHHYQKRWENNAFEIWTPMERK